MMKKTLLFIFIILLVLSIGTVSATNETDTSTSDITNANGIENTGNNDTIILSNENAQKSMTELQNTIKNNKNTTIFLTDDYQWFEQDKDLEDGIIIDKSIIIDGQRHTIDANHKMRIFQVTNNTITFKNINFLNGWTVEDGYGGAIWNNGDKNITIINCTFNGNTAHYGGAISGRIEDITNCTFTNNIAQEHGGAIYISDDGVSGNLTGTFINNIGNYSGGSIYISGDVSGNLAGTFINNTAILDGGAINIDGDVSGNLGGIFINNTATDSNGGAINIDGDVSGNLTGTFINNIGNYSGGSIYIIGGVSGNLAGTFINNTAKEYDGGAIAIIGGVSGNLAGTFINNTAKEYGGAIFIYYTGLNIIHECVFINNTIDVKSGNITLINCWFGNNATNYNDKPNAGNVNITNWLFLNATANPTKINVGETSTITFRLDSYNNTSKKISQYNSSMNLILDLTQTLGELNKNNASIGENIIYTARKTGNASVTGKFENAYYTFNMENQNMYDSKKNLTINVTTDHIIVGENTTINITGLEKATGNITITVNNRNYTATIKDGNAIVNLSDLSVGNFTAYVSYIGDENYNPANMTVDITVNPAPKKNLTLNATTYPITVGENATINITGLEKATGNVTVTINNKNYTTTITNGKATITVSNLSVSNFIANVTYVGDDNYNPSSTTVNITVTKSDPHVSANNTLFIVGNEGILNISGPSDHWGYLNVTINHKFVYNTIIKNGFAYLDVSNLDVGFYTVDILYTENAKYLEKEFVNIATVTVTDKEDTPLNINNLTINVDDVANINVTGIPKALNGRNITITITGKASKNAIINNGNASSSFTGIIAGNYIISAHYDGDNVYKANTTNATLTVNKCVPNVTAMNTSFIIGNEGTLNISGPFDRDGYLIINIGDKKYVATLNGGIASVNISNLNVGQYNVTITYQENDKYLEKEFDNIATVEVDDKYPTPLNINNLTINVDDVANINVTGIPKALNGRNITITITGKASKNAIINNGTATATFKNLTKSNYEIVAEYTGDNIYKANTTNATLTINKFIPDVSAISTSFIVGNEGILNITGSSDCIGILNITIGDNKYTSILINGKATLNVSNLGIGEYGVDIIYLENDRYYERAFYNIATVTVTDKADTPLNVDDIFINVGDDAVINVVGIPEALNGNNITVKIIDKSTKNVIIDNGKASATFHGLAAGIYGIVVKYDGDSIYKSNTTKAILTVEKAKPTTSINVEDIFVSNDEIVIVTMPSDAKGIILFNVNDKNYFADIKNGESTLIISDLPVGNYTITYIYNGDEKYLNATGKSQFEVLLNDTYDIIVESTTIQVGDDANIHVLLPIDATGTVTATVDEKYYSAPVVDGIGNIIIPDLVVGNYTALISYLGNDKYASSSISANISVSKIPDVPIYAEVNPIKFGDDAIIYVELPKDTNGTVTATVNNKSYIVSLEDGKTNINISGLDSGNYTAIITYSGNDKYESVTTNVTIEVSNNFEVFAPDVVKYYHGAERFNVYVLLNGKAVANKTVKITINGITYNKTTDTKGIASFAIRLSNGTYNVTTTVDNTTVKSNVTVLSTIIGFDLTKYYKNQTQYSVKVYDTKGKPVGKNEIVTFNVNGIFYNRTTDENGIATLNINLPPSDYIITADYKGCKISNKIKVLPVLNAEDIIMNYLDGTQFKANLVDGQGKPYKNQMVTFNVNGIVYNRLTDSNGQAALNIRLPAGEYIITSSFNGANIANKITITG